MSFTLRPHDIVTDRFGIPTVKERANYVILSQDGQTVYVQSGLVYCGDTDRPTDPEDAPTWFWDSFKRMTPEARQAVGLRLPEDEIRTVDQLPAEFLATLQSLPEHLRLQLAGGVVVPQEAPRIDEKALKIPTETVPMSIYPDALKSDPGALKPQTWTCDQCSEVVSTRKKGVHIAAHRRDLYRAQREQGALTNG